MPDVLPLSRAAMSRFLRLDSTMRRVETVRESCAFIAAFRDSLKRARNIGAILGEGKRSLGDRALNGKFLKSFKHLKLLRLRRRCVGGRSLPFTRARLCH